MSTCFDDETLTQPVGANAVSHFPWNNASDASSTEESVIEEHCEAYQFQFHTQCKDQQRMIFTHVIVATNVDCVNKVMSDVHNIIVRSTLRMAS